ncbi:MAG TPA: hypothetical protein VNV85_05380 [Puia sp.]|jgi:hypothetical protein|nr:hypothetical protein [Puia sp.]
MKLKAFLIAAILMSIISCKKSGSSGLTIKIVSISNAIVPVSGSTTITLNFTDDAGKPIDSIFMHKIRINQDSSQVQTVRDTLYLTPPSYPGNVKGQLQLNLDNTNYLASAATPPAFGNPPQNESDSLIIKFAAKDVANNASDTVTTGLIVVLR